MYRKILSAVVLASCTSAAAADDITGRASVIDGDTLEIAGQRIRLHGIDAPESSQICTDAKGADYRCGQRAAFALADKIGSAPVACEPRDKDRYGRIVAVCRQKGIDLNAWLVSEGYAMAYRQFSTDYVRQESNARAARLGIWSGSFTPPAEYRKAKRTGQGASHHSADHGVASTIIKKFWRGL